ncbi:SDR family NAD(P)-dependent oxidoreductase [Myxococcota bacterium]|nr:SDR family NAD(P)-dependent oxidoreductase [Myxococcota bacterium]
MAAQKKVALLTGASSGIGEVLALRLAAADYHVILAARSLDKLRQVEAKISAAGGSAEVLELDVSDFDITARKIVKLDKRSGGVDLVIANAGMGMTHGAKKMIWEEERATLVTNVLGASATILPLVPLMIERRRGHIVAISSIAGEIPLPWVASYSASKGFLTHLSGALAPVLKKYGVAVTTVKPGWVETPMTAKNKHTMPGIMSADKAADLIMDGIKRRKRVVTFPRRITWPLGLVRHLPRTLVEYFFSTR